MRYLLMIFVLSLILLNSCTKCTPDKEKNTKNNDTEQNAKISEQTKAQKHDEPSNQTSTRGEASYSDVKVDLYIPGKILSNDELEKYFPAQIPGSQRSQPSKGMIYGETGDVSTTSFTYDFEKGGLVMRITDYGNIDNISPYDLKYFEVLPEKPGFEVITILDDMGKGFVFWSSEERSGELYYLLANRFIIKLEAYTIPADAGDLVSFFDMLKRKELIEKIKNKK